MSKINFKTLSIKNFLSVGDVPVELDFKRGLNIITGSNKDQDGSRNGVGKSCIVDSLFYVLFGETLRELTKNNIVNNINGKNCKVTLTFDVKNGAASDAYKIVRSIAPTKLKMFRNGEDVTESSMPKTTEKIKTMVGSPELFRNAVIMTISGTVPFMYQKKVDRRKFCEGLFSLDVFSDMLLEARRMYNETKGLLSIETQKMVDVDKNLNFYLEEKEKSTTKKQERLDLLKSRKASNKKEITKIKSEIVDGLDDSYKKLKEEIDELSGQQRKQNDIYVEISNDLGVKKNDLSLVLDKIKNIKKAKDVCDKCEQSISDEHKTERIEEYTKLKASVETKIKKLEKDLSIAKEGQDKIVNNIDEKREETTTIKTSINANKYKKEKITELESLNKQIDDDIKSESVPDINFDDRINDIQTRKDNIQECLDGLNKDESIYRSMKYIFSEEGVKSYIIKKMLKLLNGKLKFYLKKLEAPCTFEFNEYFDEKIHNVRGNECTYANFSSGEQKRIDLALLFTFMDIYKLQGNISSNILFFDEILDSSLDDKGINKFFEVLHSKVEKNNDCVYIITHRDAAISAATADIVYLEKERGFTRLIKNESNI